MDSSFERAKGEAVGEHSDQDHHDHDGDDLGDEGIVFSHVEEKSEALVIADEGENQFGAHEGSPGEAETLAQAAGECGETCGEEDVTIEAPAVGAHHQARAAVKRGNGTEAVAHGDGDAEGAAHDQDE